ncbi:MAG: hemin ABC transporter substrate-binding protein [Methylomonas sp.]|nr:hemin ABC transporter substrate-binding protein [Methylomonas sp.]PPD21694.1 MAG: hemin ABC transporter substrate-binding protein [Methylomonas sp.]PPD25759.1 MAG: hemin ABC transporter substrate-binding protein [Methylomonas sp.]PPD37006.1 MAG: hemin ABC transporter substrate-binding protein [Methylomonas sp.]PPD40674.1 MAG: hemin ABC transporter substrate-binding protein [Methylomonas sp.]
MLNITSLMQRCALVLTLALAPVIAASAPPQRIVAVGGALTEIVYALDGQAHLVGVDTTSQWPAATQSLPRVGYMRNLSAEGILSLAPDTLIASAHAGPPAVLEQLRSAGVQLSSVAETYSEQGILDKIDTVAALLGKPQQGEQLRTAVANDFRQLAEWRERQPERPKTLFIMAVTNGEPMVSGRDTAADAVIQLAGGSNAAAAIQGNKTMGNEAIVATAPEVILLTDISVNALGGLEKWYAMSAIALTPAGQNRRLIVVDTLALLGFGLRTGQAALNLAERLHPAP